MERRRPSAHALSVNSLSSTPAVRLDRARPFSTRSRPTVRISFAWNSPSAARVDAHPEGPCSGRLR